MDLFSRFADSWQAIGARNNAPKMWRIIEEMYETPPRAYHNLAHIEFCLHELDDASGFAENAGVIEAAIWFHDIIYETKKKNNEKLSAAFANTLLKKSGVNEKTRREIIALIMATTHATPPKNNDEMLMVDVDLAILGKQPEIFEIYDRQIREEYAWVAEETYRRERSRILKHFLNRDAIFSTPTFRSKYELQARRNLKNTLVKMASRQ